MSGDTIEEKRYQAYDLHNFDKHPVVADKLSEEQRFHLQVVGSVFPFKTNNYVVDELIDWSQAPDDPMFVLNYPQRGMLQPHHYEKMAGCILEHPDDAPKQLQVANRIRGELNPHPAGQMEHNLPTLEGEPLKGMQHKYRETVLFFPSQAQTCHAYCTFCFRWPQFVGIDDWKFAMQETEALIQYLQENPNVSDVLFTGGDPMVMGPRLLHRYIDPLLEADLPNLKTIRIGTKSLTYWPYKFVTDKDADKSLDVLRSVVDAGKHMAFMSHFNHPVELRTPVVQEAIRRIRSTGAVIRSQAPLLRNVNDDPDVWSRKWRQEVNLGVVPYYMFVVRDTGAQHYFAVPLLEAWQIYRQAYQKVSGLARTARGPSMSADPGKVEVLGPTRVGDQEVLALRMLQGRDPNWVDRTFFARLDPNAVWLDDLQPAFGQRFFFEEEEPEGESATLLGGTLAP